MWCPSCHADVAAEVSSDNRRIRCASCNSDLGTAEKLPSTSKTREARELLKRWSDDSSLNASETLSTIQASTSLTPPGLPSLELDTASDLREPSAEKEIADRESTPAVPSLSNHETSAGEQEAPHPSGQVFRIDNAHTNDKLSNKVEPATPIAPPSKISPQQRTEASDSTVKTTQIHNKHENNIPAPHFDVQGAIKKQQQRKRINWASLGGQLLAYCGVGLITIGTALVLWGYFGGPTHYAPTGWLVATAGQMLMFLGVITLVSGGLEQTTDEVSRQLEQISQRLDRIDQQSRQQPANGPSPQPAHFSGNISNQRQSA